MLTTPTEAALLSGMGDVFRPGRGGKMFLPEDVRQYLREQGRRGGRVKSEAKILACSANIRKAQKSAKYKAFMEDQRRRALAKQLQRELEGEE